MTAGVHLRPAETLLISRARDYLAAGPADVVQLIAHICQLPAPPRSVAMHMAAALLAPSPEFACDDSGCWRLASAGAPTPTDAPNARGSTVASAHGLLVSASPAERLCDLSYAVVDVETTGGQAHAGDRITEIAAVVVRGGEVVDVYETLVNPQRPIPPMITRLTNINWAMVKDAPLFREIVPRLEGVLRGHVFVAHNAAFDWRFVSAEIVRATGEQLTGRRLCTVRLARKLLPQLPRRSLDSVARYYGVEIGARHRAGGDALATARVLLRLLRDAADRGCSTWQELELLLGAPGGTPRRSGRRRRSALPRPVDRDPTT